jgi:hypothetical protein
MGDEDRLLGALFKSRSRSLGDPLFVSSECGHPTLGLRVGAAVILKGLARDMCFPEGAVRDELEVDPFRAVIHSWLSHGSPLEGVVRWYASSATPIWTQTKAHSRQEKSTEAETWVLDSTSY